MTKLPSAICSAFQHTKTKENLLQLRFPLGLSGCQSFNELKMSRSKHRAGTWLPQIFPELVPRQSVGAVTLQAMAAHIFLKQS